MLGFVDLGKVFRYLGFYKVSQVCKFFGLENCIVGAGDVAHVGACLLFLEKRQLFGGEITA